MKLVKLAAYLDEAGEDPACGCDTLRSVGITNIALRHAWSDNICKLSDQACKLLRLTINNNEMHTMLVASDLGLVPSNDLMKISKSDITRTFDIAKYFNSTSIRIFLGTRPSISYKVDEAIIKEWMAMITELSIYANIVPVYEIMHGSSLYKPTEIVDMFNKFKRWKILYDPAQLIIRQSVNPFVKYWTLLKSYTHIIDIHDFKIGFGHKPCGYGDSFIQNTISDSHTNFNGWYILEPSLGRKYGSALTKSDTFKMGFEALEALD